jgi:hypothetical protein
LIEVKTFSPFDLAISAKEIAIKANLISQFDPDLRPE